MILKLFPYFLFLLFSLILFSCDKIEWYDKPPDEFQGVFYQVSEPIIQGYEKPIVMGINENEVHFNSKETETERTLTIVKVSKNDRHIVIFCGGKNVKHIADYRYEMFWGTDNYLHVSEIVETGYNDEHGEFEVGKFTNNEYLRDK